MIRLTLLKYKNIMSVGNHPIQIDLTKSPTTLTGGLNGSGKSTMLLSLCFGLYGKLLNQMKLEQAINSVNKKNLEVEVTFIRNGEEWLVRRGMKPNRFELVRNGELLDQHANKRDQQQFLETILGMDFKLFTQLVCLNKERYVAFMEMSASDRRKVVEDVLDIGVFTHMNTITKQDMKDLDREIKTKETQHEKKKVELTGIDRLIDQINQTQADQQEELQIELNQTEDQLNQLDEQIINEHDLLDDSIVGDLKVAQQHHQQFKTLERELEAEIKKEQINIGFYKDNKDCPTCHQSITDEFRTKQLTESDEKREELIAAIDHLSADLIQAEEQIKQIETKQAEQTKLKTKISQLEGQVNTLKGQKNRLETKLQQIKSDQQTQQLTQHQSDRKNLELELDGIKTDLDDLYELQKQYDQIRLLLKDDAVKARIVQDYMDLLNRKINQYMNAMNFHIAITLDENFKETFHQMNKESFSYGNLSTGQKTRLNIAITLAMLEVAEIKNSTACDLLMLDEFLENLDADGVEDAMRLFREQLSQKHIFVVTQRFDEFMDKFDRALVFKREEQFTELQVV